MTALAGRPTRHPTDGGSGGQATRPVRLARSAPPARGRRSWGLITLAALLVIGSGLAVAAWGLNAGDRESVLSFAAGLDEGAVITRSDLISVSVSGVKGAVPVADIETIVGSRAATDLVAGQIVVPALVTDRVVPGEGDATVGLALDPDRVPGLGLSPGDAVDVIAVPPPDDVGGAAAALDAPEVLASRAEVVGVDPGSSATGQVLVTIVVADGDAPRVATYSTQGRVALVEVGPAGGTAAGGVGGS